MNSQMQFGAALVVAVALAGCGSSSKSSTSTTTKSSTSTTTIITVPSRIFNLTLTGKKEVRPTGAPNGSAKATISIDGRTYQLCWKFSALKNVPSPTLAFVDMGVTGKRGPAVIPLGKAFSSTGCMRVPENILAQIVKSPQAYYINIHNARYPAGALRAQL